MNANEFARLFQRAEWMNDAACRGVGPHIFYTASVTASRKARQLCATCPVAAECANYASDEEHGVWAGTNDRERQQLRGRRQGQRGQRFIKCGTESGYRRHLRNGETCELCRWAANEAKRERDQQRTA